MIIEQKPLDTVTQGIDESEINYAIIESNPIIMDILSNKMYKNKIGTICREILSNAKDACIESNVKTPIEVHIPTTYEPWFSIKDYGIGMTEHDVVNIYGNYGRSTKRDSNLSIGGFGLGGKTPYIYNNQFTVTAIKDGKKCVYQFFKNAKSMPVNTKLDLCDTTESNGVEIKIAVNSSSDFYTFEKEIAYYSKWLDYPVQCNRKLDLERPKFTKHDGFALSDFGQAQMLVIIGGIPYPISFVSAGTDERYGIHGVRHNFLILFANIGEIDLISSREEVEYTPKTIQFIKNTINKIKDFYDKYKLDKTQVWMISNRKPWEYATNRMINYGFTIKKKSHSRWDDDSVSDGVYSKYVLVSDINKKLPYGAICKRIKELIHSVAFVDKKYEKDLIKIGVPASSIIDYDSLPKQKRGKLPEHKVIDYVNGVLKRHRTNDLKKELIYVPEDFYLPGIRDVVERILATHKDLSIVVSADCSGKPGLGDFIKKTYKPKYNTSYCTICNYLERLGYIQKTAPAMTYDSDDVIREKYSLIIGDSVSLRDKFPLLNRSGFNIYDAKEKHHIMKYVEYVVNKADKKALESQHIKVLTTKLTKDDESF